MSNDCMTPAYLIISRQSTQCCGRHSRSPLRLSDRLDDIYTSETPSVGLHCTDLGSLETQQGTATPLQSAGNSNASVTGPLAQDPSHASRPASLREGPASAALSPRSSRGLPDIGSPLNPSSPKPKPPVPGTDGSACRGSRIASIPHSSQPVLSRRFNVIFSNLLQYSLLFPAMRQSLLSPSLHEIRKATRYKKA